MTGRHNIVGTFGAINRHRNGSRTVCCRYSGRDAFLGFYRNGERSLHALFVVSAHGFKAELVDSRSVERKANQASSVGRHKVDCCRCRHLRRDDKITFVLTIFVVDQDVHFPIARFVDYLLNSDKNGCRIIRVEECPEFSQGFSCWVPFGFVGIAQSVGVKAGSAG